MELVGEKLIPAPILATWHALNDPEILKTCIAGCESLEWTQPETLTAVLAARIGPVSARFKGTLKLSNMLPPQSYALSFEGQGGIAGFGRGTAEVSLLEQGDHTLLRYFARAQVGGRLAQMGSRLVDAAASKITEDFFSAFQDRLRRTKAEATGNTPAAFENPHVLALPRQVGVLAPKISDAVRPAKVEAGVDRFPVLGKTAAPSNARPTNTGTKIELAGERLLSEPLFVTFNALTTAGSLKPCILACESLELVRADTFTTVLAPGIGPFKVRMKGTIQVREIDLPNSYVLAFEGPGGSKGAAHISLFEEGRQTRVRYALHARVCGFLGMGGSRMVEAVSAVLLKLFFSAFESRLRSPVARQ